MNSTAAKIIEELAEDMVRVTKGKIRVEGARVMACSTLSWDGRMAKQAKGGADMKRWMIKETQFGPNGHAETWWHGKGGFRGAGATVPHLYVRTYGWGRKHDAIAAMKRVDAELTAQEQLLNRESFSLESEWKHLLELVPFEDDR